jgi:hypothetical protein
MKGFGGVIPQLLEPLLWRLTSFIFHAAQWESSTFAKLRSQQSPCSDVRSLLSRLMQ